MLDQATIPTRPGTLAEVVRRARDDAEALRFCLAGFLDEFYADCTILQNKGIIPLALGEAWTEMHLWDQVALSVLGADDYEALWTGKLSPTRPPPARITSAGPCAVTSPISTGTSSPVSSIR